MPGLNLTAQEQNIVNYHRNTIKSGNVGTDEQGRPVTVYTTTIYIPDGPNMGKFANVPGYVNGKIVQDEDQLYGIWKKDIDANKWPIFNTGNEAGKRAAQVHQIMDDEEMSARKVMGKQKRANRVLLRGAELEQKAN